MPHDVYRIDPVGESYHFMTLAPPQSVTAQQSPTESGVYISVAFQQNWVYMTGTSPEVEAAGGLSIGSQGTKMVVHKIAASGGTGARTRMILLVGGPVQVKHDAAGMDATATDADTYIDTWWNTDGTINRIDDPEPFDRDTTPGSEGLMDEIDEAREANNID